ncbi:carbohydrate-binding protein [Pararhizobium mangrovi]|uniref:Carbohydrate-binding protein n=1 Tax=Pararhizobium mangrovi TaxID=2590452 RepID=A0A506TUS7_9HYPH|nr:carbohydrate-binding protein [Pararhizobium mangrovi]TPW25823.1 carbohydrate-binding protein [Pararhizobium mangrovi]
MRTQLADFRDRGFGTILIQARLGLQRERYLDEDFLAAYREAVSIMAELGLGAGLYDDYNWVSGHAGGRTVDGADHLRERQLFWTTGEVSHGEIDGIRSTLAEALGPDAANWLYEGGTPRFADWEIVAALLHDRDAGPSKAEIVSDVVTIEPRADGSCGFAYNGAIPPGKCFSIFLSARCVTSRRINYLLPEAGERFVAVGLEPYAQALAGLMPNPVSLLFFDQPAPGFYRWRQHCGTVMNSLLYDGSLKAKVEARASAAFEHVLLALLRGRDDDTKRLRCSFFETYTEAIHEAFFTPVRRFAQANGLSVTGHEVLPHIGGFALNSGFASIDPRVALGADFFGLDRWRNETAVDANNLAVQLSPKLGDAVARTNGRSRTMTELYFTATRTTVRGAGQWDLTPEALRAQMIRLHLLGTRQVVLHALSTSDGSDDPRLFANPRFDFAPAFNFEPWWRHFEEIASETTALTRFMEEATPPASIGVLYPLHTAFAEGPSHTHAAHFGAWCEHLFTLARPYTILDEESILRADISNGRLYVNGIAFTGIVLPSASVLRSARTLDVLSRFIEAGGTVYVTGDVPSVVCEGSIDREWRPNLDAVPTRDDIETLAETLEDDLPKSSVVGHVRCHALGRDPDGFWRIVVFNDGAVAGDCHLALAEPGTSFAFEASHPSNIDAVRHGTARTLTIDLAPQECLCVRISEAPAGGTTDIRIGQEPAAGWSTQLDDGWSFRPDASERSHAISALGGWQAQGYPTFSGVGIYERVITIPQAGHYELRLPGLATAATAVLDGRKVGRCHHTPFRIDLGELERGGHSLVLEVCNTAANRYYADTPYAGARWPDVSGLTEPPLLRRMPDDDL